MICSIRVNIEESEAGPPGWYMQKPQTHANANANANAGKM